MRTLGFAQALLVLLTASASAGQPIVFRAMDPVAPGQTVLLYGDGLGQATAVQIARLEDTEAGQPPGRLELPPDLSWQPAELLARNDQCVQAVVPAGMKPGLAAVRVLTPEGASRPIVVNRPQLWWAQGDQGLSASPGGWVRVFGKCLARDASVYLKGPAGWQRIASEGDAFTHRIALAKDATAGTYRLCVHTGRGGPAGWSQPLEIAVQPPEPWPDKLYDATAFGADPTGAQDATGAVKTALAEIQKAGGGVLYFPRGRYQLTQTLELPKRVVLRGEDRQVTSLFWPDVREALPAQIRGTTHFRIEDLTFYCSNYRRFLQANQELPDAGEVTLHRVVMRADMYRGHITPEEADRRFRAGAQAELLLLGGHNVTITDCDLYSSGMAFWMRELRGARIENNTFYNGRHGWYSLTCSDRVIFAHNRLIGGDLMATGGGINCLGRLPASQCVYYAHNRLSTMFGWDREAMTSDAGGGFYFGPLASCQGRELTLAREAPRSGRPWEGAAVFIFGGKGAGQYRLVTRSDGKTRVTIDEPFDVPPDDRSQVSITMLQRRYLILNNEFTDAGIAVQFYGTSVDHVIAGNTSIRSGGFQGIGKQYGGYHIPAMESPCHQPSWFLLFEDNTIPEGNNYRFDANNSRLSGNSVIAALGWPPAPDWPWPYNRGTVIRGNRLLNNAHIAVGHGDATARTRSVVDCLVEHNDIRHSDVGIVVGGTAAGTVLRANRFQEVIQPVQAADPVQVGIHPAESFAWTLDAVRARLRVTKADWQKLYDDLAPLAQKPVGDAAVAAGLGSCRRAALQCLAGRPTAGAELTAVEMLIGLRVRMENTGGVNSLLDRAVGGPATLDVVLSVEQEVPGLAARARLIVPEGWKADPSPAVALTPGKPAVLKCRLDIPPGQWGLRRLPVEIVLEPGGAPLTLRSQTAVGTGAVRNWLVLGPLATATKADWDWTPLEPEHRIDPSAALAGRDGPIRWQDSRHAPRLDVAGLCAQRGPAVAYALAGVEAAEETAGELTLHTPLAVQVWLNADLILVATSPSAKVVPRTAKCVLRRGPNFLLVKMLYRSGPAELAACFVPAAEATGLRLLAPADLRQAKAIPAPQAPLPASLHARFPPAVEKLPWTLVFEDDFQREDLGPNWTVPRGAWKLQNGMAVAAHTAFLAYARPVRRPVKLVYRALSLEPCDLSAFLGRSNAPMAGYLLGFGANGNTLNKLLRDQAQVADSHQYLIRPGHCHQIEAVFTDRYVGLIVDGRRVLEYDEKQPLADLDTVGVYTWSAGQFDDVKIYTAARP